MSRVWTYGPIHQIDIAQEGGFLELRFVRIKQGIGIMRDRYGLEGQNLTSKVRASSVLDRVSRLNVNRFNKIDIVA